MSNSYPRSQPPVPDEQAPTSVVASTITDQGESFARSQLIQEATRSIKWSAMSNLFPRLFTPLSMIILAALLTSDDFGVVAISNLVLALAQIVVGLGLQQALIHNRILIDDASSTAFWLNMALGGAIYLLLLVAAPMVGHLYKNELVVPVVRVASLQIIMQSLSNVPLARLQRELNIRIVFWAQSMPMIAASIISVLWAFAGGGVWALVLGPLSGATLRVVIVWRSVKWRPKWGVQLRLFRSMMIFSFWIVASNFLTWTFLYADNVIAGYFLGTSGLGTYALGYNLGMLLPGMLSSSLAMVAYPSFCALQENPHYVGLNLLKLQKLTAAVIFPICFGISAVAVAVVSLLYGTKWENLGTVVQLTVILPGLVNLWSLHAEAYRAIGRPDVETKFGIVGLVIMLTLLLIAGPYGVIIYTVARFFASVPYILFRIYASSHLLKVSIGEQTKSIVSPLLASLIMFLAARLLVAGLAPFSGLAGWLRLGGTIAISAAIYVVVLWGIDQALFKSLWLSFRLVISTRTKSAPASNYQSIF